MKKEEGRGKKEEGRNNLYAERRRKRSFQLSVTAVSVVMRYTSRGQDARTTMILQFKLVAHLPEICCISFKKEEVERKEKKDKTYITRHTKV